MTIASEITRLQTDKECIRQAIENKGVTVSSALTFDDYAACIDAIQSGSGCEYGFIDLLVVGGGGGGGEGYGSIGGGGGGGGGQVIYCPHEPIPFAAVCCEIRVGGGGCYSSCAQSCYKCHRGGDTYFGSSTEGSEYYAYGGNNGAYGYDSSSGATGAYGCGAGGGGGGGGGRACGTGGHGAKSGGSGTKCKGGGGGGGWCTAGSAASTKGGTGGNGVALDICGANVYYGGGGGGGTSICAGSSCTGGAGGNGGANGSCGNYYGSDAVCCGGGGGGGSGCGNVTHKGGKGGNGVVIIRYHTDGSDGLLPTSTGGTRYTCGVYTIHRFNTVNCVQYFHPVFA